jgi:subtilase family serine protease
LTGCEISRHAYHVRTTRTGAGIGEAAVPFALIRRSFAATSLLATALVGVGPAAIHTMTPATAVNPLYRVAGHVSTGDTTFSCQVTTPAQCYGPSQIRAAYGFNKLHADGAGRTIVIIDAYQSPTITQDLASFDTLFGLPAPKFNIIAPDGLTPFDQNDPVQTSWAGEISLDVQWAHAIAPAATIDLVLAKTSEDSDILSATKFAVDHNLGDVISQSFGENESCVDPSIDKAQHKLFAQAVSKRITLLASSGDAGATQPTCDGTAYVKAVSSPAVDPYVTGVGGTILDADGTTGAYHGETAWNEPEFGAAGGGGLSVSVRTPAYQRSLHLPSRGVPDVSYNAAIGAGVLAVWSSSGQGANLVFSFGGTSAGSPQWAGLVALTDQYGHHRQGQLNQRLYAFAHGRLYGALFHDVTSGDNSLNGVTGFSAHRGWDAVTGIGTPRADRLVPLLAITG